HRRALHRPGQRRAADAGVDRAHVGAAASASRAHRCMKSPLDWITRPGAGQVVLAAAVAVAAGYQVQRPIEVSAGSPLLSRCFRNFWGEEGGYRWSQAASTRVIPDPGPGLTARLELQVSGWRPRGEGTPYLNLTAGPAGLTARPAPGGETLSFD